MDVRKFDEVQLLILRALHEELMIPLLEDYWKLVRNKRDYEKSWRLHAPSGDILKSMAISYDPEARTGIMGMMSVLPAIRCFWDAVFAMYLLKNPTVYISMSDMCAHFINDFVEIGLDPREYENFPPYIMQYLQECVKCEKDNTFIDTPIVCLTELNFCLIYNNPKCRDFSLSENEDKEKKYYELFKHYQSEGGKIIDEVVLKFKKDQKKWKGVFEKCLEEIKKTD